jgi:pimeloyl-ACP methyl ester carboxylesterase
MTNYRKTSGLFIAASIGLLASSALADPAATAPAAMGSIVLVHGAFADGSSWDRVVPLLQARGYTVVAVHEPLSSLADDVAATNRAIDAQPGPVTLVGHSYGGVVITEAGNNPKVKSLVYVAAFAPDAKESANDLGKGQPPPAWLGTLIVDRAGYASLPVQTVTTDFAQDLPANDARLIAAKQGPIFARNFDDKIKIAAWKTKPSWYVRAEDDRMIDPRGQAVMAKRIGATAVSIKASHVVMLSKPTQVTEVILAAASAPAVSLR